MWFQHLAWNHVCMISYLHCLVFKEHCFLTSFVKSLSDFCKSFMWVSLFIISHFVQFVKNIFETFFIASFKASSASYPPQGFALLYLSDNDVYITTNLHLCQHFFILFTYFFEIQPAVITTFALSDLMALPGDLFLRTDTACRWANSQRP